MVLVPTRELAAQVAKEFGVLARNTRLKAALIVGRRFDEPSAPRSSQRRSRSGRMSRAVSTITSSAEP